MKTPPFPQSPSHGSPPFRGLTKWQILTLQNRVYFDFCTCCWCFRWKALSLVVILRCVWPLWDFSFTSYEHFRIFEAIIVTLIRLFWIEFKIYPLLKDFFAKSLIENQIRLFLPFPANYTLTFSNSSLGATGGRETPN